LEGFFLGKRFSDIKFELLAIAILLVFFFWLLNIYFSLNKPLVQATVPESAPKAQKLYWFVPDGVRAEPDLFTVFKWAEEGKLPNLKRMMENGSYGYCIPVFPSHTPANFATIFTGSFPETHGIADGPMHIEGRPLDKVAVSGFSSTAKKVPPIWVTLEKSGKSVYLLSIPGSTPPELEFGTTIRGRWGGWGADFHALVFQAKEDLSQRKKQGRGSKLFFLGAELTRYVLQKPAEGWENNPESYSAPLEAEMDGWGAKVYGMVTDSTNDGNQNYDRIALSLDKKQIFAVLKEGDWSEWQDINLSWQGHSIQSHAKFNAIIVDEGGFFRLRVLYDTLNEFITEPSTAYAGLEEHAGPMVDFVDNFPPQLIYYEEDKKAFLDEANLSLDWHKAATAYVLGELKPDVFISDTYTPNQMLTSRWWLGYIDPASARYNDVMDAERETLWGEVMEDYQKIDAIVGEMLDNADENTLIVFSSDHGAAPLNKHVMLNNLFAKEGLLKFDINQQTGEPIIDWKNSKAVFLKMDNVYISSKGLDGNYSRDSGEEYELLREKVTKLLTDLRDEGGGKPLAALVKWEDAEKFRLPADRTGDLIIANNPGYGWNEEMTEDKEVFVDSLETGYKQAIIPGDSKAMWTPFIIMGPGIKKNHFIAEPISMTDQYPTIMSALNQEIPGFVQGETVKEVFE
jgi:predicted AlkP superfamily phosphohydrolase/phosphomutase